jgi:uncharacterized FlaG/YvyC family protein
MKKLLTLAFILWFSFFSCTYDGNNNLWEKQQRAVKNSIYYINYSLSSAKDRIDKSIVKIEKVSDLSEDWKITIGDTSGRDFAVVVCDADTGKVLGTIPTE